MPNLLLLSVDDSAAFEMHWGAVVALLLHFAVQFVIMIRVVMLKRSPGETMAWILVVFICPIIGPLGYLMFGELRLGRRRAQRFTELTQPVKNWLAAIPERSLVEWSRLDGDYEQLAELCERNAGVPAMRGNCVELIDEWRHVFDQLLSDIDDAKSTCHLEFYIWHDGGVAEQVAEALIRAEARGVVCRVLVDAIGSHKFLKSSMCLRMRAAGVDVRDALPGGLLRMPFVRFDLRMHRKIVVIDGKIGYTGSLNLVDPRYFKRDAGVGQWVDAMVRVQGPAVEALQIVFLGDWYIETSTPLEELQQFGDAIPQPRRGESPVQVVPSGPDLPVRAVEHVLLTAVYAARRELILTTPYFVPSESLTFALVSAVQRGVKVILVVPKRVDSKLVKYASGAFKGELLEAGVKIALFHDGLLHTKSVTVDESYSLFGSVNLDPRSFRLNFEILLAIYDPEFTARLRQLQQHYIDRSELMDLETYRHRPRTQQLIENFARLMGPLL